MNNISGYLPGRIVFFLVCVLLCNQGPQSEVETACKILSFFLMIIERIECSVWALVFGHAQQGGIFVISCGVLLTGLQFHMFLGEYTHYTKANLAHSSWRELWQCEGSHWWRPSSQVVQFLIVFIFMVQKTLEWASTCVVFCLNIAWSCFRKAHFVCR